MDFFFRSMARDCGPRCMGVVLSGTGVDGMRGLQDIREAGGLTFAQDPVTARFQGMPTATAAGADSVLAPEAIADELVRISRHPYVARSALPPQAEEGLKKLFLLIRSGFGTDLSYYKFGTVQRRIERRMVLHKIERIEDYVRFVQGDPDELKALYKDLLISVTSFFRDGEPFEILGDVVFPRIVGARSRVRPSASGCPAARPARRPTRSASACSRLSDERAQDFRPQIFATDVDEEAIARARRRPLSGEHRDRRLAGAAAALLPAARGRLQVGRRLRDLVVFADANLDARRAVLADRSGAAAATCSSTCSRRSRRRCCASCTTR